MIARFARFGALCGLSLLTIVSLGLPKPAEAQIAVFDAANYGNMLQSLANEVTLTKQQIQQIEVALNEYNEVVQSHKLTIGEIYPLAQPYINQLASVTSVELNIPMSASQLFQRYAAQFPSWIPNQPYAAIYQSAADGQRQAIANQLHIAQLENQQLASQTVTIQSLANAHPATMRDALSVSAQIGVQEVQSIQALSGTLAAQTAAQADYTNALLAKQEQEHRDPAMAHLASVLGALPTQLTR